MLSGVARVHHHSGFKSAWEECDRLTVLKHLDNDAPSLHVRQALRSRNATWQTLSCANPLHWAASP